MLSPVRKLVQLGRRVGEGWSLYTLWQTVWPYITMGTALMIGGLMEDIGWTGIIVLMLFSFVFVHYILTHEPWHGIKKRFSGTILASEQEAGEIAAAAPAEKSKPALQFEPRFYVGEIAVSTAKLAEELHFEIAIRVFNASNAHIDTNKVRGHISCGKSSSGTLTPIGDLPPPRLEDRGRTENIGPYEEAFVILEQRVPRSIAEAIQNVSASERIQLNFRNLDVLVTPHASQDQVVRLPLWSGLSLYRRADKILVARVVEGHVALRAGAATAGDTGSR